MCHLLFLDLMFKVLRLAGRMAKTEAKDGMQMQECIQCGLQTQARTQDRANEFGLGLGCTQPKMTKMKMRNIETEHKVDMFRLKRSKGSEVVTLCSQHGSQQPQAGFFLIFRKRQRALNGVKGGAYYYSLFFNEA